jgi:CubicO group peptidase (beta-lactamase class C family)
MFDHSASRRRALLAALALISSGSVRGVEPAVPVKRIDECVTAEMNRQQIPGVAVAVVHKGNVVLAKGYGFANVEHKVRVTPNTMFQSGSVGKQFTAAAVMLLVEDGKISLDDSITKFLPDAPFRWQPITIRHLLTHTSGIPDYEDTAFDLRKDYTEEEFAKFAFGLKLEFVPGTRWNYSNTGYVLLGCIIHQGSGKFYGDLLRDRVFGPLKMKTARVISEEDIIPHRAAGYRLVEGKLKNQEWVSPTLNTTADGSLYLSLRDLLAWDRAIRTKALLKEEGWKQVYSPAPLKSGKTYPYGFGWRIDDDRGQLRHHHGGAWQGFETYIARYLGDELNIIVLTNLADCDTEAFVNGIAALFNPALMPSDAPITEKDPAVTRRLRDYLAQARDGKLPAAEFTYLRAGFMTTSSKNYQKLLEPLGDPERLDLIEYRERGDDRFFRYRAVFKKQTVEVRLTLAPNDKVSGFELRQIKDGER